MPAADPAGPRTDVPVQVDDVPVSTVPSRCARIQKHVPLGPSAAAAHRRRSAATETIADVVEGPSTNV